MDITLKRLGYIVRQSERVQTSPKLSHGEVKCTAGQRIRVPVLEVLLELADAAGHYPPNKTLLITAYPNWLIRLILRHQDHTSL